jgi:type VI secretion system protein ImpK
MTNDITNPLLSAGSNLIAVLSQLRRIEALGDVNVLRKNLINELVEFEAKSKALKISSEVMHSARYVLCACLDELVLTKAQNKAVNLSTSKWDTQSLLSLFYKDTWGGEKVFLMLDEFKQNPAENIDLLELVDLCLGLDFEGRYSVLENGRERLADLRTQLLEIIRQQRGNLTQIFPPNQYGLNYLKPAKKRLLPLTIAVTVLLLAGMLVIFNKNLAGRAQPVHQLLRQIV